MKERTLHCWAGRRDVAEETYGLGSAEWAEAWNEPDATCMLEHGHAGPHEWTHDDSIDVRFSK